MEKREVPEYKVKETKELVELIENNNTIMFASIRGLPASNFQKIKKALRDKAAVKVIKKRALLRAIEDSKKEGIKELEEHLKEDIAFLASKEDAFELSRILGESKSPVRAKAGQEAVEDVQIEPGMTELPAGPAVSELGSLGLQVKITDGKIEIMQPKVIVKSGEEVTETAASVMSKLDITPFEVGFIPLIAYDSNTGKIFTDLNIDSEQAVSELKDLFARARGMAVNLGYSTKDTITMILGKAASHEGALSKLITEEKTTETKEESTEEKEEEASANMQNEDVSNTSEVSDDNKTEEKADETLAEEKKQVKEEEK